MPPDAPWMPPDAPWMPPGCSRMPPGCPRMPLDAPWSDLDLKPGNIIILTSRPEYMQNIDPCVASTSGSTPISAPPVTWKEASVTPAARTALSLLISVELGLRIPLVRDGS